jgi:hypothetical protein
MSRLRRAVTLDAFRARAGLHGRGRLPKLREAALLCGEAGILLVAWRLAPDARARDALLERRSRSNADNDADEVMWGSPGTLLAASRDARLDRRGTLARDLDESAERLWARRDADGLWTQHLHGGSSLGLTTLHGVTGNAPRVARGVSTRSAGAGS